MPTFYLKTKAQLEAETQRLEAAGWWIYLSYQATDGSFVLVAFPAKPR